MNFRGDVRKPIQSTAEKADPRPTKKRGENLQAPQEGNVRWRPREIVQHKHTIEKIDDGQMGSTDQFEKFEVSK